MSWIHATSSDRKLYRIIGRTLRTRPDLLKFIFDSHVPRVRYSEEELPSGLRGMSHGEKVLVKIAYDLWNATGHVKLWEILEVLDDGEIIDLIEAMLNYRFSSEEKLKATLEGLDLPAP
jgi:hypothetical protein